MINMIYNDLEAGLPAMIFFYCPVRGLIYTTN
jgi:hypothetical protein